MTDQSHTRFIVHATLVSMLCLGTAWPAVAQQPAHPTPPDDQAAREALPVYPSLHIAGFGDVNFAAQNRNDGPRGFTEGQFTLHLVSALSPRIAFFGELTFTPRLDGGTGNPPATGFNAEVERAIIRFDQSDALKVSFGRYHTPINWWNTAFHHGQWLQTSIGRPELVQFGGRFIPVHFVGALVEGVAPSGGWNINYQAGIGNGRGSVISRACDAGALDRDAQRPIVVPFSRIRRSPAAAGRHDDRGRATRCPCRARSQWLSAARLPRRLCKRLRRHPPPRYSSECRWPGARWRRLLHDDRRPGGLFWPGRRICRPVSSAPRNKGEPPR